MSHEFERGLLRVVASDGVVINFWEFGIFANTLEEVAQFVKDDVRRVYRDHVILFTEDLPDGRTTNHYLWVDIAQGFKPL